MGEVSELTDSDKKELIRMPSYYRGSKKRSRVVRIGKDHPYYRTSNKGNISEPRLIMAEHLGRNLTRDDIVYLKDGNVDNKEINNLVVLTKREYHNIQSCVRLEIARERISSKISVYKQRIIDSGIDPVTLCKTNPDDRFRGVDRDKEAYERGRRGRGEPEE